mmetsp:Transcript_14963/g.20642  ORF Transcript_14963/g.20642 Transcript_14963/m.20642 type:complete len:119 (-) Transcript_14963:986-1342(-)
MSTKITTAKITENLISNHVDYGMKECGSTEVTFSPLSPPVHATVSGFLPETNNSSVLQVGDPSIKQAQSTGTAHIPLPRPSAVGMHLMDGSHLTKLDRARSMKGCPSLTAMKTGTISY